MFSKLFASRSNSDMDTERTQKYVEDHSFPCFAIPDANGNEELKLVSNWSCRGKYLHFTTPKEESLSFTNPFVDETINAWKTRTTSQKGLVNKCQFPLKGCRFIVTEKLVRIFIPLTSIEKKAFQNAFEFKEVILPTSMCKNFEFTEEFLFRHIMAGNPSWSFHYQQNMWHEYSTIEKHYGFLYEFVETLSPRATGLESLTFGIFGEKIWVSHRKPIHSRANTQVAPGGSRTDAETTLRSAIATLPDLTDLTTPAPAPVPFARVETANFFSNDNLANLKKRLEDVYALYCSFVMEKILSNGLVINVPLVRTNPLPYVMNFPSMLHLHLPLSLLFPIPQEPSLALIPLNSVNSQDGLYFDCIEYIFGGWDLLDRLVDVIILLLVRFYYWIAAKLSM
jgi:hypothetical protein